MFTLKQNKTENLVLTKFVITVPCLLHMYYKRQYLHVLYKTHFSISGSRLKNPLPSTI